METVRSTCKHFHIIPEYISYVFCMSCIYVFVYNIYILEGREREEEREEGRGRSR